MHKSFILGNGSISIGLDQYGQVYDLCFPFVGLENHTSGPFVHKLGVWVDGDYSWLDDGSWEFFYDYLYNDEHTEKIRAVNDRLKIRLELNDEIYNERNIFLREIVIENLIAKKRNIKIYFNHQFEIQENRRGDTAYYDPHNNVLIHYKGRRNFLINLMDPVTHKQFDDYCVGLFGIEGREGTFKDAEDGELDKNPIEHGSVDSVIGLSLIIDGNDSKKVDYWMCIDKIMSKVYDLNKYVVTRTPSYLIRSTRNYWKAWINRRQYDFKDLRKSNVDLFNTSLKVMRSHTDNTGAIVASTDTDLLKYGRDTYSYVWPRDAALVSIAFSRAGHTRINKAIFEFFNEVLTPDGYYMHKYRSDRSLGSSWHPWVHKGRPELPIQNDETALVIYAIWEDFYASRDVEFIEIIYNSLIRKATEFLISRIDEKTGLIKESYDLWEENFGNSTFTSCSVYAALVAASRFAEIFGKEAKSAEYLSYAEKVKAGILKYLYDKDNGIFYKHISYEDGIIDKGITPDSTIDMSSLYGVFRFGVLDVHDKRVDSMREAVNSQLRCKTDIGGIPRYVNDNYFRVSEDVPGNPWIITTLWLAQLDIARATSMEELQETKKVLDWVDNCSSPTGILSEQIDPYNKKRLSATPLTWSHAEYVVTVLDYIGKHEELSSNKEGNHHFDIHKNDL